MFSGDKTREYLNGGMEPTPRKIAEKKESEIKKILDVCTGEVRSGRKDTILRSNAIGSCIVIAAYDHTIKVGAMAHVMVPGAAPAGKTTQRTRYAADAIEELVNEMVNLGAEKDNIQTCLVGGGNVLKRKDDFICQDNIASVVGILNNRGITIRAKDLGGTERRSISLDVEKGTVHFKVRDSKEKLLWDAEEGST